MVLDAANDVDYLILFFYVNDFLTFCSLIYSFVQMDSKLNSSCFPTVKLLSADRCQISATS